MKSIPENAVFHPLVAQWLEANGYEYEHEVKMLDFGRVDFKATHKLDSHILLVECKPNNSANAAIMQVAAYALQIPNSKPAIAVVANSMTSDNWRVASKHNVQVIEIEVSESDWTDAKQAPIPALRDTMERFDFVEGVIDLAPQVIFRIVSKAPNPVSAVLSLLILDRLIISLPFASKKRMEALDELFQACLMVIGDNPEYFPFVRDALTDGDIKYLLEQLHLGFGIHPITGKSLLNTGENK